MDGVKQKVKREVGWGGESKRQFKKQDVIKEEKESDQDMLEQQSVVIFQVEHTMWRTMLMSTHDIKQMPHKQRSFMPMFSGKEGSKKQVGNLQVTSQISMLGLREIWLKFVINR